MHLLGGSLHKGKRRCAEEGRRASLACQQPSPPFLLHGGCKNRWCSCFGWLNSSLLPRGTINTNNTHHRERVVALLCRGLLLFGTLVLHPFGLPVAPPSILFLAWKLGRKPHVANVIQGGAVLLDSLWDHRHVPSAPN